MNSLVLKQIGGSLLADTKTHRYRMEIKSSSSNRLYIVAQSKSNHQWQCSCPGWVLKKGRGHDHQCKHLQVILPILAKSKTDHRRIA